MRVVWKFRLDVPTTKVEVGHHFKVVAVGMQDQLPYIWIEHDPELVPTPVMFSVYGTGHPIPGGLRWVGTFFDEPFVWHVYQGEPFDGEALGDRDE